MGLCPCPELILQSRTGSWSLPRSPGKPLHQSCQQVSVGVLGALARQAQQLVDGGGAKEQLVAQPDQAGAEPVQGHGLRETTHWS